MFKPPFIRLFLIFALIFSFFVIKPGASSAAEKLGMLLVASGEGEEYGLRWRIEYSNHLFIAWPAGFLAGRNGWEGETCYTHIHFADEVEAFICNRVPGGETVTVGTPIDAFCQPHPEYDGLDINSAPIVHGMFRHSSMFGDNTFRENCYDDGVSNDPTVMYTLLGSQTDNPYGDFYVLGEPVDGLGAHVDDPDGPGVGIADFTESTAFGWMRTHFYTYNAIDYKSPMDAQVKEWYYGAGGTTNIKDVLEAAILADPDIDNATEIVYRHGSEAYMTNTDEYGNQVELDPGTGKPVDPQYHETTETAVKELIDEEAVDRIIVFALSSGVCNLINYGPCWRDKNGEGISAIPDKTYKECIEDITDGVGPDNAADRNQLIADKPWDMYSTIYREVSEIIEDRVPFTYAPSYGKSDSYGLTVLEMLNHTVDKFNIPDNGTSLKVIVTTHGSAGGYLDSGECDFYFRDEAVTSARVIHTITSTFSWNGKFKTVHAPVEFAQPGGSNHDPPYAGHPFGDNYGAGEQVDMAIKGKYVNELGEVQDNGVIDNATNEIFDYIVLIPTTFDAESSDTLNHMRHEVLGNNELGTVEGTVPAWLRQEGDQNGMEYGNPDAIGTDYYPFHDDEFYTKRVMNASGWCTQSSGDTTVCKGDPDNPTTVIISGAILSHADGPAREHLTDAAVEVIIEAIKDPEIGGFENCNTTCYSDFNGDQKVDLKDVGLLVAELFRPGCDPSSSSTCCKADANKDGKVDLKDVVILAPELFRSDCPYRTPPCTEF